MDIRFTNIDANKLIKTKGALILSVGGDGNLGQTARILDNRASGNLGRALKATRGASKIGKITQVLAPQGLGASRVLMIGTGAGKEFDNLSAEANGGRLMANLASIGEDEATFVVEAIPESKTSTTEAAARHAFGAVLRSYRFDDYRTTLKDEDKTVLNGITVACADARKARAAYTQLKAVAEGVFLTRDLVMEPANVLHPPEFAERIRKLKKVDVQVEVLGEKAMTHLGMGSLLGVGQGSVHESKLAIMRWNGGKEDDQPVAFVGKGVCFDTGGISIKPASGMEEMTFDMGGAGTVTGLMHTLARRKAKVNAVGVVGLVENMPGGNAQRPGDVVKSMSGQTIEVLNTDAEGRLVLADALWYTQKRYNPKFMIDLATLTGAIIVALGHEYAGIFSNNDELCDRLSAAGKAEGEEVWRLPMGDVYDKKLKSRVADMANIGGRDAGSITAAQFLQRHVNNVPWVHMDIAGVVYRKEDRPTTPKYATGYGVRVLNRLVADHYEK